MSALATGARRVQRIPDRMRRIQHALFQCHASGLSIRLCTRDRAIVNLRHPDDQPALAPRQSTLAQAVSATGHGLHTGRRTHVVVHPAAVDHGICFQVTVGGGTSRVTPDWRARVPSRLNTALQIHGGAKLRMIEHIMASLRAFGIDNALVDVQGAELPIFDGSARTWCDLFAGVGTVPQDAPRRYLRILKPVQIRHFAGMIRLEPHDGFAIDVTYDRLPALGVLHWQGEITREVFVREISHSRSPGRIFQALKHVWPTWSAGLVAWGEARRRARVTADPAGHSLTPNEALPGLASDLPDDIRLALHPTESEPVLRGLRPGRVAMVVGRHTLGGARFPDEPVRHAALDLVGDLGLAGAPILGRVVAHSPTHALTFAMVAALQRQPECWEWR
jgi:UDP-3-O-[3-hydroxymyristoyl] N-acetylglucosamine deacetylase